MPAQSRFTQKIQNWARILNSLGTIPGLTFKLKGFLDRRGLSHKPYRIGSKRARFPLWCRPRSSDIHVFNQVFIDLEYACVDGIVAPGLIIDCGANVGYASAYFLTKFPGCRVIAIEPDSGNAEMLRRNLAPYRDRVEILEAGIWSHSVGLVIDATLGDGQEWARKVRECRPGETPQVIATDLATILENSGAETISLLKVDIEGSEAVVFSNNFEGWLDRVENIAIELHGERCVEIFDKAIADRPFQITRSGELTFCSGSARTSAVR